MAEAYPSGKPLSCGPWGVGLSHLNRGNSLPKEPLRTKLHNADSTFCSPGVLFVAFLDLQIAPEGFLHQPMGGTMPCLPQILEAGEGLTVKLDAHGCHIHR